jgi:hypothetical protein
MREGIPTPGADVEMDALADAMVDLGLLHGRNIVALTVVVEDGEGVLSKTMTADGFAPTYREILASEAADDAHWANPYTA